VVALAAVDPLLPPLLPPLLLPLLHAAMDTSASVPAVNARTERGFFIDRLTFINSDSRRDIRADLNGFAADNSPCAQADIAVPTVATKDGFTGEFGQT
jgi:hypothetical protein